jgi:hypothetical protein
MLILATATLISIVADRDCYYYYVPGHDWYWRSALVYRPVHYGRFFGHYGRPYPGPPRPFPQPRYRYRTPRAGWLSPTWRNSIGHAPGRNPRYDNGGPAYRRGADPRLAPPHTGRLRPRDPHFRNGPPQQRQPEPGSAGGRGPSREVRCPPQQYRPDASRSPEVRRPPQQRQPGPGRQGGGGPSREVRRPPQQRQPGPGRQGGGGPSREVRRPPQQYRPDASRSSEARRPPQQRPERGARDRNPSGNMPPKERTR